MRHRLPVAVLRRTATAALFVLAVGAGSFVLARVAPGDATTDLALAGVDPAAIAAARHRQGLDRPVLEHLGLWLAGLARLDLGTTRFGQPVTALVAGGAAQTAWLAGLALASATALGLPLGLLTGARPRGWLALTVTPLSVAFLSCPPIVLALVLLLVAVRVGWPLTGPAAVVLPALALALPLAASLERLQSQATAEALEAPDLAATLARGVPRRRVLWRHAFRQSLRPVLGIYGLVIGGLFSGSLAVEWVTGWPGLGRLTYDALVSRDVFLVAGCGLAGAALIAVGNVLADLLRVAADPRLRDARSDA